MDTAIKIVIGEDYLPIIPLLKNFLQADPTLTLLGVGHTAAEVLELAQQHCPDIVLLDLDLPGVSTVQSLSALLAACPDTKVIIVSGKEDPAYVLGVSRLAIYGYVLKFDVGDYLLEAIHAVAQGENWYSPSLRPLLPTT